MHWLIRDLRFAIRENIRRPGFTLLAILTLSLGIGAVTTMYSVIENVLLNPFPYTDPRRMIDVVIQDTARTRGGIRGALTTPEFRAYVDESNVFEEAVGTDTKEMAYRAADGAEPFWVASVTPNLFHFLGVRPLLGRAITKDDVQPGATPIAILSYKVWMTHFHGDPSIVHARQVAVVNQTLVRKYFANENPIGKRIRLARLAAAPDSVSDPSFEIVGVVADIRNQGVEEASLPEAYIPFTIGASGFPGLLVRTAVGPETMLNVIRREIRATNRNALQLNAMTLDDALRDFSFARPRFSMLLLSAFAGIGLMLVASGVYGVLAYSVSRQTREIGIRMALGAERRHVLRTVVDMALGLIGLGVLAGTLVSFITNRVISNKVWTVAAFDPIALAGGIAVIVVFGLAACSVPAMRATRIDPAIALRSE